MVQFAGPVFMLLTVGIFHFVKNCIHGPLAENVTAFTKRFAAFDEKKITRSRSLIRGTMYDGRPFRCLASGL